jgi:hypothetical protein
MQKIYRTVTAFEMRMKISVFILFFMAATFVGTRKKTGNLYRPKFMFCPGLQFSDIQVPVSVLPNSVLRI